MTNELLRGWQGLPVVCEMCGKKLREGSYCEVKHRENPKLTFVKRLFCLKCYDDILGFIMENVRRG